MTALLLMALLSADAKPPELGEPAKIVRKGDLVPYDGALLSMVQTMGRAKEIAAAQGELDTYKSDAWKPIVISGAVGLIVGAAVAAVVTGFAVAGAKSSH